MTFQKLDTFIIIIDFDLRGHFGNLVGFLTHLSIFVQSMSIIFINIKLLVVKLGVWVLHREVLI